MTKYSIIKVFMTDYLIDINKVTTIANDKIIFDPDEEHIVIHNCENCLGGWNISGRYNNLYNNSCLMSATISNNLV